MRAHDTGATAIEYAIMASLIAVVVIGAVLVIGQRSRDNLCGPVNELDRQGVSVEVGACED